MAQVAAHIDHVCQVIGDARHAGLGTNLDGGFGVRDIPDPMDSIADLPMIAAALREKGYADEDVTRIMGENWVALLRRAWRVYRSYTRPTPGTRSSFSISFRLAADAVVGEIHHQVLPGRAAAAASRCPHSVRPVATIGAGSFSCLRRVSRR